jgi:hypothetical protein
MYIFKIRDRESRQLSADCVGKARDGVLGVAYFVLEMCNGWTWYECVD